MSDNEPVTRIEPCLPESYEPRLANLASKVAAAGAALGTRLPAASSASLADLVRLMNCYYSNLIEGHNTRPRDIERALRHDLDRHRERRNLQLEAAAHIRVQGEIDRRHREGTFPDAASIAFIRWLHAEFYREAPEELLRVSGDGRSFVMAPGVFRGRPEHDIAVGRHLPPASERVDAFMRHFETRYRFKSMGQAERIVAMAAAHHRLNYIHPFPDGNGRVSRLMSHAMALDAGVGAHGLWSVSRGLARGLRERGEYKRMMDHADMPRQGDLDGRGNLSLRALNDFIEWFLAVCLDQLEFMTSMFDIEALSERFERLAVEWRLGQPAARILRHVLVSGQSARGDAVRAAGLPERTARGLLARLVERGILASETPKGPVSLRFTSETAEVLFPRLFGDDALA